MTEYLSARNWKFVRGREGNKASNKMEQDDAVVVPNVILDPDEEEEGHGTALHQTASEAKATMVVTPSKPFDEEEEMEMEGSESTSERNNTAYDEPKEDLPAVVSPEKEEGEEKKEDEKETETASSSMKSPSRKNMVLSTAQVFDNGHLNSSTTTTSPWRSTIPTGLSELSKQLRVLQAKNQYVQSEMERCQRQLKIMSESKGVSVVEMMKSLESACAKEAHAELQSQITSLQAQLEALQMSSGRGTTTNHHHSSSPRRSGDGGGATASNSSSTPSATHKSQVLQEESLKQQVVSLQLQVGEYEELEQQWNEERTNLYKKVDTHHANAYTLEATCQQRENQLEEEREKTAALEEQMVALKKERDAVKAQQTLQMNQYWRELEEEQKTVEVVSHDVARTIQRSHSYTNLSVDGNDAKFPLTRKTIQRSMSDNALMGSPADAKATVTKYYKPSILPTFFFRTKASRNSKNHDVQSTPQQSFVPSLLLRRGLERSLSDPSLTMDPDAKASITSSFVPSELNTKHRSQLFVKQSARAMDLETLCRHQQQVLQQLQEDQSRDQLRVERLEQERNAAQAKRSLYEHKASGLKLELSLERQQYQSLRSQLARREEEFSLKKDQLQSRLQVHQERTADLEGQLSSLYVAFELLQQDRSEEHVEQAELRSRLVDADTKVAQQIQERPGTSPEEQLARQLRRRERLQQQQQQTEGSATASSGQLSPRQRPGLADPSPTRKSSRRFVRNMSSSQEAPPKPPLVTAGDATITTPSSPRGSPASTIHKGYLLKQQSRKKSFLGGDKLAWKQKYVVLKAGQSTSSKGSYCFWYGDAPLAKVKGTIPHVIQGVSTATFGGKTDRPLSFVVHINPRDPNAPEVHFEALSTDDLAIWESVIKDALDVDYNELRPEEKRRADRHVALAIGKKYVA